MVKSVREHDYKTVTKKVSSATDYGYETVENIQWHFESIEEDRFNNFNDVETTSNLTAHHGRPILPQTTSLMSNSKPLHSSIT